MSVGGFNVPETEEQELACRRDSNLADIEEQELASRDSNLADIEEKELASSGT